MDKKIIRTPIILAPAGNKASFLSAIAAGADAIYCGLKLFSARMEADNFSMEELASLTSLARANNVKVYVTMNSLLKPDEIEKAGRVIDKLTKYVNPDALIIQDLAMVHLARDVGFTGELHLSTLANLSFPSGLTGMKQLGISRVVIPREHNIDEIKTMARACPENIELELFIHGALCYAVSGRCYWSSFLGGRSGLRGRCVQPCRRNYEHNGQKKRFFSCMDLSIDVLAKVIKEIPQISTWKIEGRKKGPHYVFYTVQAYKMLRDHGHDPAMKRAALQCLEQALSRPTTHYNFLPQRPQLPVRLDIQTSSGLLIGKIKGDRKSFGFSPRIPLIAGDLLRIGYEDENGHAIIHVRRSVPKRGFFTIKPSLVRKSVLGNLVFLLDRREKDLVKMLENLEADMEKNESVKIKASNFSIKTSVINKKSEKKSRTGKIVYDKGKFDKTRHKKKGNVFGVTVVRHPNKMEQNSQAGLWVSNNSLKGLSKNLFPKCWWWLPPVIWPNDEANTRQMIKNILQKGGRNFVLNAPWQISLFFEEQFTKFHSGFNLWAGPFCNQSNCFSIEILKTMGFSGVIVSPELTGDEYIELGKQSVLPLGIVVYGNWPFCISHTLANEMDTKREFTSPKGEKGWIMQHGTDYWIYPNWFFDIREKKDILKKAGYTMMVSINEPLQKNIKFKKRPGIWNWDLRLL